MRINQNLIPDEDWAKLQSLTPMYLEITEVREFTDDSVAMTVEYTPPVIVVYEKGREGSQESRQEPPVSRDEDLINKFFGSREEFQRAGNIFERFL